MSKNSFTQEVLAVGQLVVSKQFKGYATIMDGPNKKDEYKVALGLVQLWIRGQHLSPAKGMHRPNQTRQRQATQNSDRAPVKIDLHGLRVAEAIEELSKSVDRAIINSVSRLEIIHGIGSGKVQRAVHEYLSKCKQVSSFKQDEHNPGCTWVYL